MINILNVELEPSEIRVNSKFKIKIKVEDDFDRLYKNRYSNRFFSGERGELDVSI